MRGGSASWVAAVASALVALAASAPPTAPAQGSAAGTGRQLSARATLAEFPYRQSTRIVGALTGAGAPVAGAELHLQASPYPYRGFADVGRALAGSDGAFVFDRVAPDRNTRYRVVDAGGPGVVVSPVVQVLVDAPALLRSHSEGPGRVRFTLLSYHPRALSSRRATVFWFVAAAGTRHFSLVASNASRELRPWVTYATAVIDPPARRFAYRACFTPPWELAMGPATAHRRCPRQDFLVSHRVR